MKASELRIGNLVQDTLGVVEIGLNAQVKFADVYKPIPLTEEWLYRFGFESTKEGIFKLFKDNKTICTVQEWDFGNFEYSQLTVHGIYIYYVHQLQNLYFALTNQELTLI